MILFRNIIIELSTIAGILFPKIFLIKGKNKESRLTIYNLHSTSHRYYFIYKSILEKINKEEIFINPENIDDFFNQKNGKKSFSLLTLDDGFSNNLEFAMKVLGPLNIKAIFFIIPNLIYNIIDNDKCQRFFEVLYPKKEIKIEGILKKQFTPLTKKDILKLKESGHSIGMHGFNHEEFSKLNEKEIKKYINKGINIFTNLNLQIDHFAYPFGCKNSFNNKSNNILKKYFKYIHTGIRGSNYLHNQHKDYKILKRHPISSHKGNLIYFPIRYKEIKFFTSNKLSIYLNLLINKAYEFKNNIIRLF